MNNLYQIEKISDIVDFLEEKGKGHRFYHHYSTWDSLKAIVENRSFLLTKGNSLSINDQHEATKKGSWDVWEKTYIGSFSFGESEIMSMWGLYGLPWEDAVRISIPRKYMLEWINGLENVSIWENNNTGDSISGAKISLTDVVYVSGKKSDSNYRLTHAGRSFPIKNQGKFLRFDEDKSMTGYVKNYAWQYENEVRIRIELPEIYGAEKIKIDIPENVVKSFIIVTGPNFEYKNDELYQVLVDDNRIIESEFTGLLKYKGLCTMCEHKRFKRH